jgi:hypothetical protein
MQPDRTEHDLLGERKVPAVDRASIRSPATGPRGSSVSSASSSMLTVLHIRDLSNHEIYRTIEAR